MPKQERKKHSLGSGFIVSSKGYIVTSNHVIANADDIKVTTSDGREFHAHIVGIDERTDIAVLKIDSGKAMQFVEFGESKSVRVTDKVIVIGNPFGLGCSVTQGIVSSPSRASDNLDFAGPANKGMLVRSYIQSDAAANPGNSGGPMFDINGKVIGVTFAISSPSGASAGITFALPADAAKPVVNELIKQGKIRRGMIGISGIDVTREIARSLGRPNLKGVLVERVLYEHTKLSGIKEGDVIVRFDGKEVSGMKDLQCLVSETALNSVIDIVVVREGFEKMFSLKIISEEHTEKTKLTKASIFNDGILFQDLDNVSRRKLGFSPHQGGVIVKKVFRKGTMLNAGDVIFRVVNHGDVRSLNDWARICRNYKQRGIKSITVLAVNVESKVNRCVNLELSTILSDKKK